MSVTVVIPTVTGREAYLARCLTAYRERTPGEVQIVVIENAPTCGIAWQAGSEQAANMYLHLTADDILPDHGWFEAMKAATDHGAVPVGLVIVPIAETLDSADWPISGAPVAYEAFLERQPSSRAEIPEGYVATGDSEYPSVPFCSMTQWQTIGPMIAAHYGTDKWFGRRAKNAGFPNVVTHGARFWHYVAHAGRANALTHPGWLHTDRLDFDLNVAWPEYTAGLRSPLERHPLDGTREGRDRSRAWRNASVPDPQPWQLPGVPEEYQ